MTGGQASPFYTGRHVYFHHASIETIAKVLYSEIDQLAKKFLYYNVGHLETRVSITNSILLLPFSKLVFWDNFLRNSSFVPSAVVYFDDLVPFENYLAVLFKLEKNILYPILERSKIHFQPKFREDNRYKKYIYNKYYEGTKYSFFNGECLNYKLKSFEKP